MEINIKISVPGICDVNITPNKKQNNIDLLLTSAAYMQPSIKSLISILRTDHQKKSYERSDYESVDEKSLS